MRLEFPTPLSFLIQASASLMILIMAELVIGFAISGEFSPTSLAYMSTPQLLLGLVGTMVISYLWLLRFQPRQMIISASYLKQSGLATSLIALLFIYENQDGFFHVTGSSTALVDFLFIMFQVLVAWWMLLFIFRSTGAGSLKSSVLTLSTIIPVNLLLCYLYFQWIYDISLYDDFWFYEVPLKVLVLLAINFYSQRRESPSNEDFSLEIKMGSKRHYVQASDVSYFFVANKLTTLVTTSGNTYIMDHTLNKLEAAFRDMKFFRANRQLLISRKSVQSFSSIKDKKVKLELAHPNKVPGECIVSRLTAPRFRRWMNEKSLGTFQL